MYFYDDLNVLYSFNKNVLSYSNFKKTIVY